MGGRHWRSAGFLQRLHWSGHGQPAGIRLCQRHRLQLSQSLRHFQNHQRNRRRFFPRVLFYAQIRAVSPGVPHDGLQRGGLLHGQPHGRAARQRVHPQGVHRGGRGHCGALCLGCVKQEIKAKYAQKSFYTKIEVFTKFSIGVYKSMLVAGVSILTTKE